MVDHEEVFRTPAAYSDRVRRDETLPPTVPVQQHDEIPTRRPSTPAWDMYTKPQPAYPADHLETLIGIVRAPEINLLVFRGDTMQYHGFMRAFDDNVERVLNDPSSKLVRPLQLCTGEVSRVIQGCTMMHPGQGYARARQLLEARFGDVFVISKLWGQRLLNIGSRVPLREFTDKLCAYYDSLYALDALGELQTQGNLLEIIKKLPAYLQNKWRDVVRQNCILQSRIPF